MPSLSFEQYTQVITNDAHRGNHCPQCQDELTNDMLNNNEASAYAHYFCGSDCVDEWQHSHQLSSQTS